jgi:hypothetical protein
MILLILCLSFVACSGRRVFASLCVDDRVVACCFVVVYVSCLVTSLDCCVSSLSRAMQRVVVYTATALVYCAGHFSQSPVLP